MEFMMCNTSVLLRLKVKDQVASVVGSLGLRQQCDVVGRAAPCSSTGSGPAPGKTLEGKVELFHLRNSHCQLHSTLRPLDSIPPDRRKQEWRKLPADR